MRTAFVRLGLAALAAALLAPAAHAAPAPRPDPDPAAAAAWRARETARIQAHLDGALEMLRARDLSALTPAQRAARERSVAALQRYRDAGRFPHNHHFRDRVPFFVDEHGTLCAMAYLIAESGREDLVRKVAAARNNALVRELADDPELVAWLEENGMTEAEAARVQPQYGGDPWPEDDEVTFQYAAASVLSGAASGATIVLNLLPARTARSAHLRGALGMMAGGLEIAVGVSGLPGDRDALAIGNIAVGTAAAALGARALLRPGDNAAALERRVRLSTGREVTLTALPVATVEGGGVHVNVKF